MTSASRRLSRPFRDLLATLCQAGAAPVSIAMKMASTHTVPIIGPSCGCAAMKANSG